MAKNENSNNYANNINNEELIGNCLDDFEILKILGEGSFGCVFKVKSKKNNKIYALKKLLLPDEKEKIKNKREILLMKYLNHENICKGYSEFKEQDGTQYMVLEFYNNKDLFQYLIANKEMNPFIREEILWNIIFQCIEGLAYLHLQGIIHCDIKLGNIFMTEEGRVVIGDFGESMVKDLNILQNITQDPKEQNILKYVNETRGTPSYMAPEVGFTGCDEKADVYSLGITFYALYYAVFPNENNMKINFNNQYYSDELKQLIKGMIEPNPEFRTDLASVKKEFNKFYYRKYIKNSGIHSVTQCLLNFTNLRKTIASNSSVKDDNDTNSKRINVSFILISIYTNTELEMNNFYLKKFISEQFKMNIKDNNEISPLKVVFFIINSLNHDLNTIQNNPEEDNSLIQNILNRKVKLGTNTNIKVLYNEFKNSYNYCFKSIITTDCLGVLKVTWSCHSCNTSYISFEKFFSITFNINNIRDSKINILDLFNKFNQYSFEIGLKKYVSCEQCKKFTKYSINKKFYTLPDNLIIMFNKKLNNNSEIELLKEIQFNNSTVESFSNQNKKYILVGIIYENENMNENSKYIPIINENQKWYQFKYGQIKEEIDFEYTINSISKKIIALFYNKYKKTDNMFSSEPIKNNEQINNKKEKDLVTNIVMKNDLQKNIKANINNDMIININSNENNQKIPQNNIQKNIQSYNNANNQNNINMNFNNQNKTNMNNSQNNMNYYNQINNTNNSNNIKQNQNNSMSNSMNNLNNQFNNLNINNNNPNLNNNLNNEQIMDNNQMNKFSSNQNNNMNNFGMNNNQQNAPNNMNMNNMNNYKQNSNQMNTNMNNIPNINYSHNNINMNINQNNNMQNIFLNNNNMNFMQINRNSLPQNSNYNRNANTNEINRFNNLNFSSMVNNNRNSFSYFNNNANFNANFMNINNNSINLLNHMNNNNSINMNNSTQVNPSLNYMNQNGINLMPMQNNINIINQNLNYSNMMNFNGMNNMNNLNNYSMIYNNNMKLNK